MDGLTVVYIIVAFCVIFAAASAYLIYQHVQEEKRDYYKNRLRKEKAQEGPSNYAQSTVNGETKKPLLAPAPAPVPVPPPEKTPQDKDDGAAGLPVVMAPAPLMPAPVPVLPVNGNTPAAPDIKISPSDSNTGIVDDLASSAAVAGGAAVVGGAAVAAGVAVASQQKPPIPSPPQPQFKNEENTKKKKKEKKNKQEPVSDFDDYRNGSPKQLPPANPAPEPAQYNYPSEQDGPVTKSRDRLPLDLPPLPPDSREGLNF